MKQVVMARVAWIWMVGYVDTTPAGMGNWSMDETLSFNFSGQCVSGYDECEKRRIVVGIPGTTLSDLKRTFMVERLAASWRIRGGAAADTFAVAVAAWSVLVCDARLPRAGARRPVTE